jgi:hypothetical protein
MGAAATESTTVVVDAAAEVATNVKSTTRYVIFSINLILFTLCYR